MNHAPAAQDHGPAGPPSRDHTSWRTVGKALTRPYRVTLPMILLVALIPFYLVIADRARTGDVAHVPALPLDGLLPTLPAWALVYGALYAFLILLPILVIQREELIRRTVQAYLAIWITAYAIFLLFPTAAPRPEQVAGDGFAAWGLRFLYAADPPYNCFPSIHVAHSFVSALACYRLHRRLGFMALACAALVALSTLFTRQHYVADLIAGIVLAVAAYVAFLRGFARPAPSESDVRIAPALAIGTAGVIGLAVVSVGLAWYVGLLT